MNNSYLDKNNCQRNGGVIKTTRNSSVDVENSYFIGNIAVGSSGGVAQMETDGAMTTKNCTYYDNTAASQGGVMLFLDGSIYMDTGSKFVNNKASDIGAYYLIYILIYFIPCYICNNNKCKIRF